MGGTRLRGPDIFRGLSTWRKRWDSNPRDLAVYLISSQARYDHFDTLPWAHILYHPRPGIVNQKALTSGARADKMDLSGRRQTRRRAHDISRKTAYLYGQPSVREAG